MSGSDKKGLSLVALAVALIVGTVGFFNGVLRDAEPQGYLSAPSEARASDDDVLPVPTQAGLASSPHGPNRERFVKNWARLTSDRRGPNDDVGRPTEAEWNEAMATRRENRAFNGAPPIIPHSVGQQAFPSCLSCHRDGLVIEGRTAPAMSHEQMDNCTQCHVTLEQPGPGIELAGGPPSDNSFGGVHGAGRGERAGPGAPPTIPHTTFMRERCESCHGVLATGLRTSHACRQNCLQCHGTAAELDQQPTTSPPALPLAALP